MDVKAKKGNGWFILKLDGMAVEGLIQKLPKTR